MNANDYVGNMKACLDNLLWAADKLERNKWLNHIIDLTKDQRQQFKAKSSEDGLYHTGYVISDTNEGVYVQDWSGKVWICLKETLEEV